MVYGNFTNPIGQMFSDVKAVTTTPQLITTDREHWHVRAGRRAVEVLVLPSAAAATVYISGKDVEIGKGAPVFAGDSRIIPVSERGESAQLYMVADAPCDVIVIEYTE